MKAVKAKNKTIIVHACAREGKEDVVRGRGSRMSVQFMDFVPQQYLSPR